MEDYLITTGIVPLLQNRFGVSVDEKTAESVRRIEQEFAQELATLFSEQYSFSTVTDQEILAETQAMLAQAKHPLIVYDDVYGIQGDFEISSTRLTAPDNHEHVEIGPRPGARPLIEQHRNLEARFSGKTVDLYDIGVFAGETLLHELTGTLNEFNIKVGTVYLNVGNESAINKFREYANIEVARTYRFGEWLEIRDPLGFDGRKVLRNKVLAHREPDERLIIPYKCEPAWSSVPAGLEKQYEDLCQRYETRLTEELAKSGISITREEVYTHNGIPVINLQIRREK